MDDKVRHSSGQTKEARALSQKKYNKKSKQKKNRAERNAARAKEERLGRVHKGDHRDVDHISGTSAGNSLSNLRILSSSTNRRYNRRSKRTKLPK